MEHEPYVIPTSLIGPSENVSGETVKKIVRDLEAAGEIEVLRPPTNRSRLNIPGYKRVRAAIRAGGTIAA